MKQADSKHQRCISSSTSFGHSQSMRVQTTAHLIFSLILITGGVFYLQDQQVYAEVITDGTVGVAQNLGGPDFVIPQSLGSTQGTNLFHSFQNFNITNTESATFTGANSLQNVISRVTGGQSSSINGLLRSQVGQAAFYFINPAGVVFGADAVVDVPGDFHVSTASELGFSDGAVFRAAQSDVSALSMASPAEFGFLSDQSGALRVEQSNLVFASGTTTSLNGGSIVIDSGVLVNEGGVIRLTAVGVKEAALPISDEPNMNAAGTLDITNSILSVDGNGAGQIMINAGGTRISNSLVTTGNTGTRAPKPNAGMTMVISSLLVDDSFVATGAFSSGNSGSITISATDTVNVINGGNITTVANDSGNAGDINVSATNAVNLLDGGMINSNTSVSSDAGKLGISTGVLTIDSQSMALPTGVFTNTAPDSTGNAGNINVSATEMVNILNGGVIASNTLGGGNAGNINVSATQTVNIVNGGSIVSNTLAAGNSGIISLRAKNLIINGRIGDFPSGIFSNTVPNSFGDAGDAGDAGDVDIFVTDSLNILNGGQVSTSTFSQGDAGDIIITAGQLVIDNQNTNRRVGIASDTNSEGQAGNITVNTGLLSIANGGAISNGSIIQDTNLDILRTNQPITITITAVDVTLVDSFIASLSDSNDSAGSISINASNRLFLNSSNINTEAINNADGGDISLSGRSAIIQDSQIRTTVRGQGDGGDIALDFNNLVLDTGFIQANTAGSGSQGGDITINVDALTASGNVLLTGGNTQFPFEAESGNNAIQAAAPDGVNGAIDISSPELNIKGDLAGLTSDLTDIDTLVRDPCSIAGAQQSILITGRRGGLPETAQDALAVPLNRNRLQKIMSDPDSSGKDIAPHQPGVLLDGRVNRSALAFVAGERSCVN